MCPFFSGPKYHNLWINQVWYGDPIISHYSLYMRGLTLWPVVRRDKWIIYWGASESEWLDSCNNVISIFGTDYLLQITILSKQPGTGEYFTKKRNFCQGPCQFLPTKFWGKFWQKHQFYCKIVLKMTWLGEICKIVDIQLKIWEKTWI